MVPFVLFVRGFDTTLIEIILTVAAIVLGGVGWNINQLTVEQVEWALKVVIRSISVMLADTSLFL